MYVTESVNIPEELERQLKRDRLVLFVGAGVSVPSGLPGFFGLAAELAGQSGHLSPAKKDADRLDYFIGRLSDDHFNTHENSFSALPHTTTCNRYAFRIHKSPFNRGLPLQKTTASFCKNHCYCSNDFH